MAICVATCAPLVGGRFRMARGHFFERLFDQRVDQVVGLHAQALAAGDFDVGPLLVFLGELDAQLGAAARRKRHHLVGEVDRLVGLLVVAQRAQAGHHDVLQIGLPRVDHVVDARRRGRTAGTVAAAARRS